MEKDNYEKDRQAITKQVEEYKAQIKTLETNYALGK